MQRSNCSYIFLFYFYSLACLILPVLDLKKYLFLLIIAYWISELFVSFKEIKFDKIIVFRIFIIYLLFLAATFQTIWVEPYNLPHANFIMLAFSGLLITLISYDKNIDILRIFNNSCFILSIIIIGVTLCVLFLNDLSAYATTFVNLTNAGHFGRRDFGGTTLFMIEFRPSPALIIPFLYYFHEVTSGRKKSSILVFKTIILFLAICCTASRGTIFFSLIGFIFISGYNFFKLKKTVHSLTLFIGLALFVIVFLSLGSSIAFLNLFNIEDKSNSMKMDHILSFLELVDSHPGILLTGSGLGSEYYTQGFNDYTWQTEVAAIDMIRYFGIFGTLIIMAAILVPLKKNSMFVSYYVPFFLYFLNAQTNPLIFNSTGVLVISVFWANQLYEHQNHTTATGYKAQLRPKCEY